MSRPAIIIGLGGTGQWILTNIKKNLLEAHGEVPDQIKLLSFDTMSTASVSTEGKSEEEDVRVGGVMLEKGKEFISLTGKVQTFGEDIAKGRHPYISSWFDAKYYLGRAIGAIWDLGQGAGQIRQFGRLAFYAKAQEGIQRYVDSAIQEIRGKGNVDANNPIQLMVVASFAGGTGAGMFVDMGLVCRNIISEATAGAVSTFGFFVLPSAFGATGTSHTEQQQHMLARSFAAWRELDRFMSADYEYGLGRATYMPGVPGLDFEIKSRPYDFCFIVDSFRQKHDLSNIPAPEGVFPSVADYMTFLLDEHSGREYVESVLVNAEGTSNQALSQEARYSVIGSYKIKSPVYYRQQEFQLNATSEILEKWLAPARDKGLITGLSAISNQEVGGRSGRDDALRGILKTTGVPIPGAEQGQVQKIAGTLLMQKIAELYNHKAQDDMDLIAQDADGGFSLLLDGQVDSSSYIGVMTQLPGGDPNLQDDIRRDLEASDTIFDIALPSKDFGDPTIEAPLRFNDEISRFFKDYFGSEQGGIVAGGRYGRMLKSCQDFHITRFKDILYQYSLNALNGIETDSARAKGGKLGFLLDAVSGLKIYLDYFNGYLTKVQEEIDRRGTLNQIIQDEEEDRLTMMDFAGAKNLVGGESKKAHETQEAYLASVDRRLTYMKDTRVMDAMSQTAQEMLKVVNQVEEELQEWVTVLVGDRKEEQPGLYEFYQQRIGEVDATFRADKKIQAIQKTLKLDDYKDISSEEEIEKSLDRLRWNVNIVHGEFKYSLYVALPEEYTDEDGNVLERDVEHEIDRDVDNFVAANQKYFTELGGLQFRFFPREHFVVDDLRNHSTYKDSSKLGQMIKDYSQVLFSTKVGKLNSSELTKAFYVSAQSSQNAEATAYMTKVQDWLKDFMEDFKGSKIELAEAEDPFTSYYICSYSNVPSTAFSRWYELRDAYLRHIQRMNNRDEASRLHIFPAEYHASRYEHRLPSLRKSHRVFHPAVVMLLEYERRLSLFFRGRAYGVIEEVGGSRTVGYRFYMPDNPDKREDGELDILFMRPDANQGVSNPNIFEILNAFVINGKDMHTKREIPWPTIQRRILEYEKVLADEGQLAEKLNAYRDQMVESWENIGLDKMRAAGIYDADANEFGWSLGQEYLDLADVLRLMMEDAIEDREKPAV